MNTKKHANIPIFIPHLGCPNDCVFCNQRSISGKIRFEKESVEKEIKDALATISKDTEKEIAFFGGSFTGIDRDLMIYLLDTAQKYIDSEAVSSIRMSTRPDYISDEIFDILSHYSVGTIELGLQSMDDHVLDVCHRGHSSEVAINACREIKKRGYSLIGQMMIGLPGATIESEIATAELICQCGADGARVYPTVVFYNTELCNMSKRGEYIPLETEEAVERTKHVLAVFDRYGVPCIRVGLCASENLSDDGEVYGGANHSAIGEMAMSRLFRQKIEDKLISLNVPEGATVSIYVPKGCVSKAVGQKRENKIYFAQKYKTKDIKVRESDLLQGYCVQIIIE